MIAEHEVYKSIYIYILYMIINHTNFDTCKFLIYTDTHAVSNHLDFYVGSIFHDSCQRLNTLKTCWGDKKSGLLVFSLLLLMEEILHQLIGSLSHYLQSFVHPRWCKIPSINSSTLITFTNPGLWRLFFSIGKFPPENAKRSQQSG